MEKTGYVANEKGQRIDNILDTGTLTGNWLIDHYGCWWEYKLDKPDMRGKGRITHAWIIGDYPDIDYD